MNMLERGRGEDHGRMSSASFASTLEKQLSKSRNDSFFSVMKELCKYKDNRAPILDTRNPQDTAALGLFGLLFVAFSGVLIFRGCPADRYGRRDAKCVIEALCLLIPGYSVSAIASLTCYLRFVMQTKNVLICQAETCIRHVSFSLRYLPFLLSAATTLFTMISLFGVISLLPEHGSLYRNFPLMLIFCELVSVVLQVATYALYLVVVRRRQKITAAC